MIGLFGGFMSVILLAIKSRTAFKIMSGEKRYEYRKRVGKNVKRIVIYSTLPVKKVIGEAQVLDVIKGSPMEVWNSTKDYSGTTMDSFFEYFKDTSIAYAYKLGRVSLYKEPKELSDYGIYYFPQSYVYLEKD